MRVLWDFPTFKMVQHLRQHQPIHHTVIPQAHSSRQYPRPLLQPTQYPWPLHRTPGLATCRQQVTGTQVCCLLKEGGLSTLPQMLMPGCQEWLTWWVEQWVEYLKRYNMKLIHLELKIKIVEKCLTDQRVQLTSLHYEETQY